MLYGTFLFKNCLFYFLRHPSNRASGHDLAEYIFTTTVRGTSLYPSKPSFFLPPLNLFSRCRKDGKIRLLFLYKVH